MHFDSDAAVDGRRVTAIIYVNDDWVPGVCFTCRVVACAYVASVALRACLERAPRDTQQPRCATNTPTQAPNTRGCCVAAVAAQVLVASCACTPSLHPLWTSSQSRTACACLRQQACCTGGQVIALARDA
jgi:hypothetical protein